MANTLPAPSHSCALSAENLQLIGLIVHNWTLIESFCRMILGAKLGLHHDEQKQLLSFNSMESMADLLRKVATHRIKNDNIKNLLLACIPELKRLAGERAVIVHGMWATNIKSGGHEARLLKNVARSVTAADIERVYAETANLSNAIAHVWWDVLAPSSAPSPWLDKWSQGNHPCPP